MYRKLGSNRRLCVQQSRASPATRFYIALLQSTLERVRMFAAKAIRFRRGIPPALFATSVSPIAEKTGGLLPSRDRAARARSIPLQRSFSSEIGARFSSRVL